MHQRTIEELNKKVEALENEWSKWQARLNSKPFSLFFFKKRVESLKTMTAQFSPSSDADQELIKLFLENLNLIAEQCIPTKNTSISSSSPRLMKPSLSDKNNQDAQAQAKFEEFNRLGLFDKKAQFVKKELYKRAHPLPPSKNKFAASKF